MKQIIAAIPAEDPAENTSSDSLEKPVSEGKDDGLKTANSVPKSTNETSVSSGEKSSAGIAEIIADSRLKENKQIVKFSLI